MLYSFVYFFIALPRVRISFPLYDFLQVMIELITIGRPGTTQRFVAVDLLIFFYFLLPHDLPCSLREVPTFYDAAFREAVGWPVSQNVGLFSQANPHWSGFETNLGGKKTS